MDEFYELSPFEFYFLIDAWMEMNRGDANE